MAAPTKISRLLFALAVLVSCIATDRWTKSLTEEHLRPGEQWATYVGGLVEIRHEKNTGAFLGWGAGFSEHTRFLLLTVVTGLFVSALGVYAVAQWNMERAKFLGIQLIFAGGLGNLVDRVAQDGEVTDFMVVGSGWLRTGVFNVADVAITTGALLLLWLSFRKPQPQTRVEAPSAG